MSKPESLNLEEIYHEHASAMFAFVVSLTRNESDARDILQDIFCQLSARPKILQGIVNIRSCLLKMAYRRMVDASRRRKVRERHALETTPIFATCADPDENAFREALVSALFELPEDQRAVVHLKLWEQLTFAEIATALDIPLNTAASRYRYGLDKLRTLLRPIYEEIT